MTPPLIVIGISGLARSGKDTVANHLVHCNQFFRIALADGIRASLDQLDGPTWQLRKEMDEHQKTARWAMQTCGGECRQAVDESLFDVWMNLTLIKIRYLAFFHPVPRKRFVVPDIRHAYEPDRLRKIVRQLGGHYATWKINRPGAGLTGDAATHASEVDVHSVVGDTQIRNHLDLGYLFGQVDNALDDVLEDAK